MSQPVQPVMPTEPVGRKSKGTGFTNIQNLLKANVGAAEKMGTGIGQALGKKAGQLKEDVSAAGSKFQEQYGQAVNPAQTALTEASRLIPSSVTDVGSAIAGQSEEYIKDLGKKVGEASYSGPMGLEGASQLGSRAASLAGMGDLARSGSMGQGLLLQDVAGRRSPYTRGQTALDTMLLGQSKEAQKSIKEGAGQTYGAKQQAETLASSAETQAKQAKDYIKGERSRILGEAAKSAEGIEKYGKEQGEAYVKDATRLKDLIEKAGRTDLQTGQLLINPNDLDDYDRDLLSRAGEFGVDLTGTFVDPRERFSDVSKDILKGIAGTANLSEGGLKLTGEQSSALKNLALLQQQASPEIKEFNTKRFSSNKEDIGTYIDALAQEQKDAFEDEKLKQAFNIFSKSQEGFVLGPKARRMTFDEFKAGPAGLPVRLRNYDWWNQQFESGSPTTSFSDTTPGSGGTTTTQNFAFNLNALRPTYTQTQEALNKELLAQKGISIGDYLKSLYKINPSSGGGNQ